MKVLILTEGNREVGYGHITRCTSIGQAFRARHHEVTYTIKGSNDIRISDGVIVSNYDWYANQDRLFQEVAAVDLLFIDSMSAPHPLLDSLCRSKLCAIIDDFNRWEYPSGLIIDWTVQAESLQTVKPGPKCEYLLGTQYVALRRAFWNPLPKIISDRINEVMVSFGGSDLRSITPLAVHWLQELLPDAHLTIIIGAGAGNLDKVREAAGSRNAVLSNLDDTGMVEVMGKADLALAAGGQTLYELARIGVPTIAVTVVDNQMDDVNGWDKLGFIINAGSWNDPGLFGNIKAGIHALADRECRARRSAIGQVNVDGQGADRIVRAIESFSATHKEISR